MSFRSSVQRAAARFSSLLVFSRAWLMVIALLAATPGLAQAACGAMSVPDGFTVPATTPMASGGTITVDASRCDDFGLNPYPNPGTTNPAHGTVSVDPIAGTFTYTNNGDGATSDTFIVEDASNNAIPVTVTIAAATSPITVSPASLPTPNVGTAYSQTLSASGGTAPYSYALTGGSLAPGLSLSGATISGTPNQAGGYTATITVTDATSTTATKSYTVNVPNPSSGITVANPPTGTLNSAYSYNLNTGTSGALAPYTYTLNSGSLPTGLALAGNGSLSGTPTAVGTYNFAVVATDSSPNLGGLSPGPYGKVVNLSMTVQNVPPTANPVSATVAYGSTNNPITLNIAGAPATSVAVGTAASHGTATASGTAITYTPTAGYAGPDSFTYTATNGAGTSAPATVTITVSPPTIVYAPGNPSSATVGTVYSESIASASDGAAPYTYAVSSGALPAGITLASNGTLSGTPTAGGTFTFQVTATDSSTGTGPFSATPASLTLTVDAPTIALSPTTLPATTTGSVYSRTLSASGGTAPYTFAVTAGPLPAGLSLTAGGVLSGTPTSGGTFIVTITATDSTTGSGPYTGSRAYVLTVRDVPGAPVIGTATAGDGQASVAFSAPASNGGSAITSYTATSLPGGITATCAGSPCTVAGLTNGTSYTFTVTATNAVGTGTASAASNSVTPKASQAITFNNPATQAFGTTPTLTAAASSGLVPTFSSTTTGVCTITAGGSLTFVSAGTCTIDADQPGDGTYAPAATVTQSFTVAAVMPGAPAIGTATAGDSQASVAFSAPASNGGAPITSYTVTSNPGGATGVGAGSPIVVTGLTNGVAYTFTVTATNSAGTGAASAASNSVTPKGTQTITFANPGAQNFGTSPTLVATADSGLTVTFSSSTTAVCTITGAGTLTFLAAGTCTIAADQAGDAGYLPAPTVTRSFTVNAVVPGAPIIGIAVAGDSQATVSFSAPANNGGAAISGYTVTSSPGGITANGAGSPLTVTGLTNGVAYTFTVTANNSAGTGATSAGSNSVTPAPTIVLSPAMLTTATAGAAFSDTIGASGGTAPYTFAITAGTLPAGLSLAADGTLSGTPTAGGNFNFTVTATDNLGFTGSQAYALAVNAATLVVSPASLSTATAGVSFSDTISASGGTAPYGLAITAGALPAGLLLAADGTLSGTPTAGGSFNFTVTATDASSGTGPYTASRAYTLVVGAPTITLSPAILPAATAGSAYSASAGASGGTAPYTFAITAGALPAGLSLAADGTLSGTPTIAGSFNFTITATDGSSGAGPYTGSRTYTLTVGAPAITIAPATLIDATVATAYGASVTASGGTAPYTFAITAGSLPAGLSLAADGTLSGTPTAGGTFNATVTATDALGFTGSRAYTLTVVAPAITVTPAILPGATAGVAYSQAIAASGGTSPYGFAVTAGALPAGLSLAADGTLSGSPTTSGSFTFTVTATDASVGAGPYTGSRAYTLIVGAPVISIAPATLPAALVGATYTQTITASGGNAPYTFAATAGALPGGLALTGDGTLSGTPTAGGNFNVTVTATDALGFTAAQTYALTVNAPTITVAPSSLPAATGGTAYSGAITATGGTAPYTFAITAGALPTGVTLAADGTLSGMPITAGTFNFAVTATDGSTGSGPYSGTQAYALTVAAPAITITPTTLTNATAGGAYAATLAATGGNAPYGFVITAGTLPAGMSLASDGTLSGTPTVDGSYSFSVSATDVLGFAGSQAYTLTVGAPAITLVPATLADATAGTAYGANVTASGGTAPYTFAITAGALPAGVSLASDGTLAGTPTAGGTFNITVTATDALGFTGNRAYALVVGAAAIVVTPATLAPATGGTAYTVGLGASGGTAPYTFAVTAGALPPGVALASDGTLSGTPTASGSFSFTVAATDSSTGSGPYSGMRAYTLSVDAPTLAITPATLADATTGSAYSATLTAAGGTAAYRFAVTGGTLPGGISLASDGTLAGTPTAGGSFNFTVTATDALGFTATQAYTLAIAAPAIAITPATLPDAVAGTAYSQGLSASGGTAPYTFAVTAGALPAGVSLAGDGSLSGTPAAAGSFNFSVTATDSSGGSGPYTVTRAYTLDVSAPTIAITPATLPGATAGLAYNQAITASGGTAPYTFAITTGALPAGVTLAGDGTLAGMPTVSGAFNFTISATDSLGFNATQSYTLMAAAPAIAITPATLPVATVATGYGQTLTASGGTAPYTFAVGTGALPDGLGLASDGSLSGTPTAGGTFNVTIVAADALGFTATQAYTLVVAAPAIAITPATLPGATAGTAYGANITASGGTAPYSFAITTGALPAGLALAGDGTLSGTPTVSGSFDFTVTATDGSTGSGPYSAAQPYTLTVNTAPPVVVPDSATTLSGVPVDIAVTANDSGNIDSIAIASTPQHGTATVAGLVVSYAPAAGYAGEDGFSYIATGPGGTSAPATVTVTVHPVPVAVSRTVDAMPGIEVTVDLGEGATGGPFTGATLVALAPATAGMATVAAEGNAWVLRFTPDAAFSGNATARFTLANAYATSAEATITFQVQPRPDPSVDAEVQGLLDAQVESARRFAQAQLGNFRQRLEQLHGAGRQGGNFSSSVAFAERACAQAGDRAAREECLRMRADAQEVARGGGPSDAGAVQADASAGPGNGDARDTARSSFGAWAGGMIRSGSFDGRGGSGIGFESDGLSVGVDFDLTPAFTLGAGLGYGRDDNTVGDEGSRLEGRARAFVAYASYHPWEHLFVDGTLGYQQLDYDTTRRLTGVDGVVRGRRDGDQWFASLSVGADLQGGALQFTPYVRVDVARGTLDGYTEAGHPFLALRYGAMDIDSTTGNLGLRLDFRHRTGWGWFTPQLRLEYQREFADAESSLVRYADLANGPYYTLTPSAFDRNRIVFGLGATLDSGGGWSTRVEYQAQAGDQRDEGVQVNVQKDF